MRTLAGRFCALVGAPDPDRPAFARELAMLLAELVAVAIRLPEVQVDSIDLLEGPSAGSWEERYQAVGAVLGEWDGYSTVLEPTADIAGEMGFGSLADDLVDIWADLETGLRALDAGASDRDVLWQWRFSFWTHWGAHATAALQLLHIRLADSEAR